jgi:hypothetical protein
VKTTSLGRNFDHRYRKTGPQLSRPCFILRVSKLSSCFILLQPRRYGMKIALLRETAILWLRYVPTFLCHSAGADDHDLRSRFSTDASKPETFWILGTFALSFGHRWG